MNQDLQTDIGVVASTVTTVAGVIAGLQFSPTLGIIMTAIGVTATAVLGYLKARSAEKSARKSAHDVATIAADALVTNNSKTVLVQTVTAERAKWRAEMREHVADLVMLLRASGRSEIVEWREIDRLRTGVRLRLNPAGRRSTQAAIDKHEMDRKLHAVLDELDRTGPQPSPGHTGIADQLEEHMAELLKAEWDKSKNEAVTGMLNSA